MYRYGYYGMDLSYILVLIGAVICLAASARVKSVYRRYVKQRSMSGMTGAQTAQRILQMNGVTDVTVQHIAGSLTDHYDPAKKVVNLSDAVYGSSSVAAVGVAAHECGHVMQHHEGYLPLQLRTALVPAANIGSNLGLPIILISILLGLSKTFTNIGVALFSLGVLFQIVTLPVEFNASSRALKMLEGYGILGAEETKGSRAVLNAAALTYVASAASMVLQLMRLLAISNGRSRRR